MKGIIRTITPQEAVEKLRSMGMKISPDVIRSGLEQKVFPFGDAVENGNGGYRYFVYSRLLDEWIGQRVEEVV